MRDITQLHPELQKKLHRLSAECEKAGLKIGISECLRSTAEQDERYAQGRTKPGPIVTNCKGSNYASMHQWGVASDFYRNDGKGVYNDRDNFFTKVGKIGQKIGLEWGGSWKSIVDKPHFQLPNWGSTASQLKAKYGTPAQFFKTWNVTESKTTVKEKKYHVTAKSGLRLRNKPTVLSKTIVTMPREATFVYAGESKNGFYKGTYGKKMGWASAKYLK
jgi:peptidoglycan L-alanyl-D-glutamate endopeptidase CwlK